MVRRLAFAVVCVLAGLSRAQAAQTQPPAPSQPSSAPSANGSRAGSPNAVTPTVFVLGEVRSPGPIDMTGSMTLIDVLIGAGNPTGSAGDEVILVRRPKDAVGRQATLPGKDVKTIRIGLQDLLTGRTGQQVVVEDGDTVIVPKAETFYIRGEIRNPGAYILHRDTTVERAIALAGDLTARGNERRITIVRRVNGREVESRAKLTDIVHAEDTINVGRKLF